ncbi:hypothetical protein D3C76_977080 [compost metagenome]
MIAVESLRLDVVAKLSHVPHGVVGVVEVLQGFARRRCAERGQPPAGRIEHRATCHAIAGGLRLDLAECVVDEVFDDGFFGLGAFDFQAHGFELARDIEGVVLFVSGGVGLLDNLP